MEYVVHTADDAPEAAKGILTAATNKYGFTPNLLGVMAEAPALLKAYTTLSRIFDETSLSPTERQVVLLTASVENECEYCVAAHSMIAGMQGVASELLEAIRIGRPIEDPRLEALRQFTAEVTERRGWPSERSTKAVLGSGYTKEQLLEVLVGVGMKTLSNYTNHIAETPLDDAFAAAAWSTGQSIR